MTADAEFAIAPTVEVSPADIFLEVFHGTVEIQKAGRAAAPARYGAFLDGFSIEVMPRTAARIAGERLAVMPHIPARLVKDKALLADWIARYQGEAGVDQALLLAGGIARPTVAHSDSMQLLETDLLDKAGFDRLHVAGHPEGIRDFDPRAVTRRYCKPREAANPD
jgi:methylenetetrahydrofolate reductase (NADH)